MRVSPFHAMVLSIAAMVVGLGVAISAALSLQETGLPHGAVPVSISPAASDAADDAVLPVEPLDLVEEPDVLPGYAAHDAFYNRQQRLNDALSARGARVNGVAADGTPVTGISRDRSLSDLPLVFWFQLGVASAAILISAWVWSLRRGDPGAVLFAIAGVGLMMASLAASVYSTRPLAMNADMLALATALNRTGTTIFGWAFLGLFMVYPRRLVSLRFLPVLLVGAVMQLGGHVLRLVPYNTFEILMLLQLLGAFALAALQWRESRHRPVDRAGLRWFLICALAGTSAFISLRTVPSMFGGEDEIFVSQGYAFGFLLTMHLGIALGISRYRIFQLDELSYRLWLWLTGAALVIGFDLVLLSWLRAQPWMTLSLSVLAAGIVYFPLRQIVLDRFFAPRKPDANEQLAAMVEMSGLPEQSQREAKLNHALQELFQPAQIERLDKGAPKAPEQPDIAEDGLALLVPPIATCAPRRLRLARKGRRLFNRADVRTIDTLASIATIARDSRIAFRRGADDERARIARDVHDNLGARLLSALTIEDRAGKDDLLRQILLDLRTVVNEADETLLALAHVLADLQAETADRCELAGLALNWSGGQGEVGLQQLTARNAADLSALLREIVSNLLKHAGASEITISWQPLNGGAIMVLHHDGALFESCETMHDGKGLENMNVRTQRLGGTIQWAPHGKPGLTLSLPACLFIREVMAA